MFEMKNGLSFLLTFLLFFQSFASYRKNVYVIDCSFPKMDMTKGVWGRTRDAINRLGYEMKWVGFARNLEDCHKIICFKVSDIDLKLIKKYPKEKRILFLWEPPVVRPNEYKKEYHDIFEKIYTWSDELVDNIKYFKFCYPIGFLPVIEPEIPFGQKKLCAMINCNKDSFHERSLYQERRNVIEFFEDGNTQDFDLYGYGWNSRKYKSYRGTVKSKIECLKNYKFCFAYENTRDLDGYITEKIFDVMFSGAVPIYLGAANVTDYIPKDCFIDRRDFESYESLYSFLKNMPEREYSVYLENIKKYLKSDLRLIFSWELMIDAILESVEPGYDRKSILNQDSFEVVSKVYEGLTC